MRIPKLFLVVALLYIVPSHAQERKINEKLLSGEWSSRWITCPEIAPRDYGVYHFRKKITLPSKPASFIIHVTADNRYRLFVNGAPVCFGPARGDLYNWYFETLDIASYLKSGENTIAVLVWNMGTEAPVAQISNQTGLVVQGDGQQEQLINSDKSWKVYENKAYKACSKDNGARLQSYMVIGPGDEVDASLYPWGWEQEDYDDNNWKNAMEIAPPVVAGYGTDNRWSLQPRNIPLMEETLQRMVSVRRAEGMPPDPGFIKGQSPLTIPAGKKVSILLDQTFNTVAYPELRVSGGKKSSIKLTYAEALYKEGVKGNRNEIEGKKIKGNYDVFKPDGGENRTFRPLWIRTYRYLQLDIETGTEPLVINDLYGMYTGYPFVQKAYFKSNDASLKNIWNVGWRTARLCAGETYYDCPYYEQLQYEGDTRIQSLISLYVTGDDRLMRKALLDFYHSRVPEGLTQGRYPSNRLQVIPPFSLFWVSMAYDYWMHRPDEDFARQFLIAIQGVLDWYEKNTDQKQQMLGPMKWWNFVDWNLSFPNGVPDGATDGNSSVLTLQYVYTLQQAAALFEYFGKENEADHYRHIAQQLSVNTYRLCFDDQKKAMANTPQKNKFSQHAGIMGVLTGAIPISQSKQVMQKILYDTTLSQATFYYRFYLNLALKVAGMGDLYYEQLKPWRDMLANGLSTFAENPDPTRSDCHAWSASPNYDFFATICGIMPSAPGFREVLVQPALGDLKEIEARMPHPDGEISVSIKRKNKGGIKGTIELPGTLKGKFVWKNREIALKSGKQEFEL